MSTHYDRLVQVVNDVREDLEKAEGGNKAATSRVRKSMQEIKNIAQDIRKEMLEVRDAGGPAKPAASAPPKPGMGTPPKPGMGGGPPKMGMGGPPRM
jgi:hypothetical protein